MRLLKSSWLLLALLLLLVPHSATAQTAEQTETITFTLYNKTHTLTRPLDLLGNPADLNIIKEAITKSVQYYDRQWGAVAPTLWLQLLSIPSPLNRLAEAARFVTDVPEPGIDSTTGTSQDVCWIRIYNTPRLSDSARLKYTLAHELVHCYQGYLIPSLGNHGLPTDIATRTVDDWWLEGSADWLAPHVYPMPEDMSTNRQWIFGNSHTHHLIDGGHSYDEMFFWESLERSLGGLRGPLDILTGMPARCLRTSRLFEPTRRHRHLVQRFRARGGTRQFAPPDRWRCRLWRQCGELERRACLACTQYVCHRPVFHPD